jgi:hypothetical protein
MPYSRTVTIAVGYNGVTTGNTLTVTGDNSIDYSITVPGPSTNLAIGAEIDVSAVSFWRIMSTIAMTLKTNSTSAPDNTLTLTANVPAWWATGCGWTNPLTVDIENFYATIGGVTDATLTIEFLQDATP